MHTGVTQNTNDEAVSLAGVAASSFSGPAAREASVIQFSRPSAAASLALEDATLPSTFESVGEVAVRLVGRWKLPRVKVQAGHGG